MEYIITTDTHFAHENIKQFGARPEGFEELILDNLEKVAKRDNILIHLGDIAWRNDRYWNRRLTSMLFAKKWLIRGNHDKQSNEWYISNGWDFVGDTLTINYNNKVIVFSHKPVALCIADLNLHGHFHNIDMERVKEKEPELYNLHNQLGHTLLALEHHYLPFNLKNLTKETQ